MIRIDAYSAGSMTVDGKKHRQDLKIIGDRMIPEWRRDRGHLLRVYSATGGSDHSPVRRPQGRARMALADHHHFLSCLIIFCSGSEKYEVAEQENLLPRPAPC